MGRREKKKNQEDREEFKENQGSDKSKKGGIGRVVSSIILVVALAVIAYSGYQLFMIFKGYHDGRSEYEKIRDIATEEDDGEDTKDAADSGDENSDDGFSVDFNALKAINSDVIGWIRFAPQPETINYPIVKGTDNSEYLHRTFSANENTLGAIFLNYENASDFTDRNSIIYGHRMNDGSMFAHLQDYDTKSFWESNPYFYIYTVDGRKLTYHVVMAGEVSDESSMYQFQFPDDAAYLNFLNAAKSMAFYDTGIQVTTQQKVVTLSTCTRAGDSNRIVVMGVLEKEEKK